MYDSRPKHNDRGSLDRLGRVVRRGETSPRAKLSTRQVLCIRAQAEKARLRVPRRRKGRPSHFPPGFIRDLAAAYGVHVQTIYDILYRKRWRHV